MFEYLLKHDQIVVTGPHRSGTTIVMEMIAHDLGHEDYREEKVWHWETLEAHVVTNHRENRNSVYQVPLLSSFCHRLPEYVAVVFVIRKEKDILASQKRINWGDEKNKVNEKNEIEKYSEFTLNIPKEWSAARVKYKVWNDYQKKNIKHAYEVNYDSLNKHSLWIPKEKRQNFNPRQTGV